MFLGISHSAIFHVIITICISKHSAHSGSFCHDFWHLWFLKKLFEILHFFGAHFSNWNRMELFTSFKPCLQPFTAHFTFCSDVAFVQLVPAIFSFPQLIVASFCSFHSFPLFYSIFPAPFSLLMSVLSCFLSYISAIFLIISAFFFSYFSIHFNCYLLISVFFCLLQFLWSFRLFWFIY